MHVLFWSDVCYRRSVDHGASIRVLLSMPALDRMLEHGMMNVREHETLLASDAPPSRWYMIEIEWWTARNAAGLRDGLMVGGPGFEQIVLYKATELRGACMGIPDELAARIGELEAEAAAAGAAAAACAVALRSQRESTGSNWWFTRRRASQA